MFLFFFFRFTHSYFQNLHLHDTFLLHIFTIKKALNATRQTFSMKLKTGKHYIWDHFLLHLTLKCLTQFILLRKRVLTILQKRKWGGLKNFFGGGLAGKGVVNFRRSYWVFRDSNWHPEIEKPLRCLIDFLPALSTYGTTVYRCNH